LTVFKLKLICLEFLAFADKIICIPSV